MNIEEEIQQKVFTSEHQKAVINISFTAMWMISWQNKLLKPYGISIQQFNILRILRGQHPNPAPLKLLTDRMIDKMSNTSRLVEKLRTKDLVHREVCEGNRRQVDIIITEKGLELIQELSEVMEQKMRQLECITNKEAGELNRILDKLRNGFEAEE